MSTALFQRSRCLNDNMLSHWPLVGLIPGQTYVAFTSNSFMLQKSEGHGKYEILSRNNSSRETYLVVSDSSGTLQLCNPGDEVCGSYIRTATLTPMHNLCMCVFISAFVHWTIGSK